MSQRPVIAPGSSRSVLFVSARNLPHRGHHSARHTHRCKAARVQRLSCSASSAPPLRSLHEDTERQRAPIPPCRPDRRAVRYQEPAIKGLGTLQTLVRDSERRLQPQFTVDHLGQRYLVEGFPESERDAWQYCQRVHGHLCKTSDLVGQHIPRLVEAFQQPYRLFIVWEHIGDVVPVSAFRRTEVVRDAQAVLAALHQAGVVHGNVTPDHWHLHDGRLWLTGWRCAALRRSDGTVEVHPIERHLHAERVHPAVADILDAVPNPRFKGVCSCDPAWAPPTALLGFGPSVAGDMLAVGMIVAHAATEGGAPWRGHRPPPEGNAEPFYRTLILSNVLGIATREYGLPGVFPASQPIGPSNGPSWRDFWLAAHPVIRSVHSGPAEEAACTAWIEHVIRLVSGTTGNAAIKSQQTVSPRFDSAGPLADSSYVCSTMPAMPCDVLASRRGALGLPASDSAYVEIHRMLCDVLSPAMLSAERQLIQSCSAAGEAASRALRKGHGSSAPLVKVDAILRGCSLSEVQLASQQRLELDIESVCLSEQACSVPGPTSQPRNLGVLEIACTERGVTLLEQAARLELALCALGLHQPLQVLELPLWAGIVYSSLDFVYDKHSLRVLFCEQLSMFPRLQVLSACGGVVLMHSHTARLHAEHYKTYSVEGHFDDEEETEDTL